MGKTFIFSGLDSSKEPDPKEILSAITVYNKYAKFDKKLNRRESWEEIAERSKQAMLKKYKEFGEEFGQEITNVFDNFVKPKKVLNSMRFSQFSGVAVEKNNSRVFNCSYTPVDNIKAFSEAMFLSLGGTGVGYSVQEHHVTKLPSLVGPDFNKKPRKYLAGDSIEGWADTIKALVESYFKPGKNVVQFDLSDIREKGAELVTAGGKAPGPEPLGVCLENIRGVLDYALKYRGVGTKLRPIEAHDIMGYIADAVYAGGIRRSAMIAGFSVDDENMLNCKSNFPITSWEHHVTEFRGENGEIIKRVVEHNSKGETYYDINIVYKDPAYPDYGLQTKTLYWVSRQDLELIKKENVLPWFYFQPQRGRANNSVVLLRSKLDEDTFKMIWKKVELSKAGEPGFYLTNDKDWFTNPCAEISLRPMSFCNLTEINASTTTSQEDLNDRAKAGAFLGTLQAGFTDFHYLRPQWRENAEKEALIGVGITGLANKNFLELDLKEASKCVLEENERVSKIIGINKAYRATCVKPSGCRPKNALVTTTEGVLTLEELLVNHMGDWSDIKDYVLIPQENGITNLATKSFANGKDKVYAIHLSHGVVLESTGNHPWAVSGVEDSLKEFIEASKLKVKDKIKMNPRAYTKETENIVLVSVGKKTKYGTFLQPSGVTPDLAWFFGYIWKYLSVVIQNNHLSLVDKNSACLEKAQDIIQENFNIFNFLTEKVDGTVLDIYEPKFIDWLRANKLYNLEQPNVIPSFIRKSSWKSIVAFLGGFVDSYFSNTELIEHFLGLEDSSKLLHHIQDVALSVGVLFELEEQKLIPKFSTNRKTFDVLTDNMVNPNPFFLYEDVFFEVEKIVKKGEEETFDVSVENDPWFYAGAFKSHNTTSLVVGSSSGVHAWHNDYYIRRMRIGKNEDLYKYLVKKVPELIEDEFFSPETTAVIAVPQKAPEGAIVRSETPIETLERVKHLNMDWVRGGHRKGNNTHNTSCTISLKNDEWDSVGDWMWENRDTYNGISVLPYSDHTYKQAPFEDITKEKYEELLPYLKSIDLSQVTELEDNTDLSGEIACGGEGCEVI